ncbi:MAG: hypothetical protein IJ511_06525 [Bacteroides sp.]|nr:hypothetical protein [Bacteroides sp.]
MKNNRYASHVIIHPEKGIRKQAMIEVAEGKVIRMAPLQEELEDVQWLPGAIILSEEADKSLLPYWNYPFDLTSMQPVAGTRRRQLP